MERPSLTARRVQRMARLKLMRPQSSLELRCSVPIVKQQQQQHQQSIPRAEVYQMQTPSPAKNSHQARLASVSMPKLKYVERETVEEVEDLICCRTSLSSRYQSNVTERKTQRKRERAKLRKGRMSAVVPQTFKGLDGRVHAIKARQSFGTGAVRRMLQDRKPQPQQKEVLSKMKKIQSKLEKSKEFLLSKEYLTDHSYLIQPQEAPVTVSAARVEEDGGVVPSLSVKRLLIKRQTKEEKIERSTSPLQSSTNLRAVRRADQSTRNVGGSPMKLRRVQSAERAGDLIAINKIATELASTVRKNFQFSQGEVNKFIMAVQRKERQARRPETSPTHRPPSEERETRPALWHRGMSQLRESENDIIVRSSHYLRSESLPPSRDMSPNLRQQKGWEERSKPKFRAAHAKSARARKQTIPRSLSSMILREKLNKALVRVGSRKFLKNEESGDDEDPAAGGAVAGALQLSCSQLSLSDQDQEEREEERRPMTERKQSSKSRERRWTARGDLETQISIELNQLLEKNSLISGKIESHSSIGRTVNLRLIAMLHRLKNRKTVIQEAYANLRRKEAGEGLHWGRQYFET